MDTLVNHLDKATAQTTLTSSETRAHLTLTATPQFSLRESLCAPNSSLSVSLSNALQFLLAMYCSRAFMALSMAA